MKKKILSMLAAFMILSVVFCQSAFAEGGLTLVSAFPKDGGTGYQISNQMARLVFSEEVTADVNKDCFHVFDSEGESVEVKVLEQKDEPERINLVFTKDLKDNSEYKIVIDGGLTAENGDTLGKDVTIEFKTKNMKTESLITTVLMFGMFGVIIVMTFREQAKSQKENNQSDKNKKVNPYKEAKKEAEKIVSQRKKERDQKVKEYQKASQNKNQNQKKKK